MSEHDLVACEEERIGWLRERLGEVRDALGEARAAYLRASRVSGPQSRLRVDWFMVAGLVLALPLFALIAWLVER